MVEKIKLGVLVLLLGIEIVIGAEKGLVGWWKFDEGEGGIVKDSSGNKHDGIINGAKWVKGKEGNALYFDGDNDYVLIKDANLDFSTNELTIEVWVNQETYFNRHSGKTSDTIEEGATQLVVAQLDGPKSNFLFDIIKGEPGFSAHGLEHFTVDYYSGGLVPLNKWTHIAVTYNGEVVKIYINGKEAAKKPYSGKLFTNNGSILIGGYSPEYKTEQNKFFQGIIDEVRIYNKCLTFSSHALGFIDLPDGAFLSISSPSLKSGPPLKAEVKVLNGVPTLFINGNPKPVLICREQTRPQQKTDYLNNFSKNGVNIFVYAVGTGAFNPRFKNYSSAQEFYEKDYFGEKWNAPIMKKITEDVPDALFLIQSLTDIRAKGNSQFWEEHPDEIAVWPPNMVKGDRVSLCSELWRQETIRCLKEEVSYLKRSPFADRIVGYFLCGGGGEWGDYWDYSKPAQEAFKKWVKDKYKGDTGILRDKWKDEKITFDTISIPKWEELFKADIGIFYDPRKSQRIIDFLTFHTDIEADVISDFARAIKEATNGEIIVGAWVGAMFYPGWASEVYDGLPNTRRRGAFEKLIKDPNIDFFFTPYNYRERHAGGIFQPQYLLDSAILHKKIAIQEDDTRTYVNTKVQGSYNLAETLGDNFGQARTIEETLSVLRRNFAGLFSKPGSGIAWYNMGGPPGMAFNHPEIFKDINTFSEIANNLIGQDKKNSQIAVFFSNNAFYYQKFNWLRDDFITRQYVEGLARIGAPFDMYLDTDLEHPEFPFSQYKLYIFTNTCYLANNIRKIIKEKVETKGNTVLWIYAPGFITDSGLSVNSLSDLTGIQLDMSPEELLKGVDISLTNYDHPITKGLATDLRFGTRNSLSPIFWCVDKEAVILGEELATPPKIWTFRKPGLCVKKFNDWTSIWSGAPNLPSSLLRNIARYAGVHIYDDGDDQVFASEKLLSIHTRYAGERIIRLPKKSNVYDPFQKKYIARGVKEFKIFIPAATTELWILE